MNREIENAKQPQQTDQPLRATRGLPVRTGLRAGTSSVVKKLSDTNNGIAQNLK